MAVFVGFQGSHFIITAFLENQDWEKPNFLLYCCHRPSQQCTCGRTSLDTALALPCCLLGRLYMVVTLPLHPHDQHRSLLWWPHASRASHEWHRAPCPRATRCTP